MPGSPGEGGSDIPVPGTDSYEVLRHWDGNGSRAPVTLSYGRYTRLPAGAYAAIFSFRSSPPKRKVRDSWGWFSVHVLNTPETLAQASITPSASQDTREQTVPFHLEQETDVEPRITGADAELWLAHVDFVKMDPESAAHSP